MIHKIASCDPSGLPIGPVPVIAASRRRCSTSGFCRTCATLDFLRVPPGNRLEALRGDRGGSYSIRINDQWRLCFRFADGDAYDVEIVDYH